LQLNKRQKKKTSYESGRLFKLITFRESRLLVRKSNSSPGKRDCRNPKEEKLVLTSSQSEVTVPISPVRPVLVEPSGLQTNLSKNGTPNWAKDQRSKGLDGTGGTQPGCRRVPSQGG
jgi:hypothetical protein